MEVVTPGCFPTRPTSASIARPQPVRAAGHTHDNVFITQAVLRHQRVNVIDKRWQERSASAIASGQVGNKTQAIEFSRCGVTAFIKPLFCAIFSIFAFSLSGTPAMIRFWFAVMRNSPLWIFAISSRPVFSGRARIIEDTAVFNKQRQMPFIVDPFHPADTIAATGKIVRTDRLNLIPARRSTSALKVSTPTRSSVYLVLAFLQSVRLPQSRCVVTTASATASVCSSGR